MAQFFVFQGTTYSEELQEGLVWAPQKSRSGGKNPGFEMMKNIKKGQIIFHSAYAKVLAISIAQTDCYASERPSVIESAAPGEWDREGFRVDTKYLEFDVPIELSSCRDWIRLHNEGVTPFNSKGGGKQQYMCNLPDIQALFFLDKAISLKQRSSLENILIDIKRSLISLDGYEEDEKDFVDFMLVEQDKEPVAPNKSKMPQEMRTINSTGTRVPKRDISRAVNALRLAGHKCEYDSTDMTFHRKNGLPYMEPHHLIPLSKYMDFEFSVDVEANIVSLCSHHHNLLHYGSLEEKRPVLRKLYQDRIPYLTEMGLFLTYEQLEDYYK